MHVQTLGKIYYTTVFRRNYSIMNISVYFILSLSTLKDPFLIRSVSWRSNFRIFILLRTVGVFSSFSPYFILPLFSTRVSVSTPSSTPRKTRYYSWNLKEGVMSIFGDPFKTRILSILDCPKSVHWYRRDTWSLIFDSSTMSSILR